MLLLSTRILKPICLIVVLFLAAFFQSSALAQTVEVRVDGDDGLAVPNLPDPGDTWPNAFKYLPDAIVHAQQLLINQVATKVQIWVAEWEYHPDQNAAFPEGSGDRNSRFPLLNNVEIYGGFEGNDRAGGGETLLSQRRPLTFITTLSGDVLPTPPSNPPIACTDPDVNAGDCFEETPGIPGCADVNCCDRDLARFLGLSLVNKTLLMNLKKSAFYWAI